MLADALLKRGHSVTRWAGDYNHLSHQDRIGRTATIELAEGYRATLLHTAIKYGTGATALRFVNNCLLTLQFYSLGTRRERPNVIVCAMPTPEMALASALLGARRKIPLILDARDMWPDILESEAMGMKRWLLKPVIGSMKLALRYAATRSKALVGITDFFRDHLLHYASRAPGRLDSTIPLGFRALAAGVTAAERRRLVDFWIRSGVHLDRESNVVYFAGRLNKTVAAKFHMVVEAAGILSKRCPSVQIVIAGSGSEEGTIRELAAMSGNIALPGEVTPDALAVLGEHSLASLLAVDRRVDYQNSLSNKFFEYLSNGRPILSYLNGLPGETISACDCGWVYNSGTELASQIERLIEDPALARAMGERAKLLFDTKYDSEVVYETFVDLIEAVAADEETTD